MFLNNKRTAFNNDLSQSFIASGIPSCLGLSNIGASIIFACIINAFLIELGLKLYSNKVAAYYSSKDFFANIIKDEDT